MTRGRNASAAIPNATPVISSTSGYRAEIGIRQCRQAPRSSAQDSSGTLSRAEIGEPQPGHAEGGETIDMPIGTR